MLINMLITSAIWVLAEFYVRHVSDDDPPWVISLVYTFLTLTGFTTGIPYETPDKGYVLTWLISSMLCTCLVVWMIDSVVAYFRPAS